MAFTNPRVAAAATSAVVALAVVATPADAAEPKAPKNIIYMVGDGMGYNHVAAANLWQTGQSKWMLNGENSINSISNVDGKPVQAFEQEDKGWKHTSMTTFQYGNEYDEIKAWSDRDWINKNFTDSAAAATAMGTGVKTDNGKIGVDHKGEKLENTSQRAVKQGKAAGVVSSVPFNHATPAGWGGHNENRSNYTQLADEMLGPDSPLSVIMGAGHPLYDDNAQKTDKFNPKYITEETYNKVANGETDWSLVTDQADFESLAKAANKDAKKVFGLAPVANTLQQGRDGSDGEDKANVGPYLTEFNKGVPTLATMSLGALNTLNQDEDGFHLMIEGGAIDWTGHANTIGRSIEETIDFFDAVEAVEKWVEANSSWEDTLLIVTADHETGYLAGPQDPSKYSELSGEKGAKPEHTYNSDNHTNQLVGFWYKGAGSDDIYEESTKHTDKIRGSYIDNTTVARLTLDKWWNGEQPADDKKPADGSSADSPWLIAILSILGVAGLLAVIAQAAPSLVDNLRTQLPKF